MAAPSQLSWWRYCVVKLKKPPHLLHLIFFAGQAGQAYAQAALQYAYAPNMLAAQQLTAAGDHHRSHCHHIAK